MLLPLLGTTAAWAPDGPAPAELPSTSAGRLVGEVLGESVLVEAVLEEAAAVRPLLPLPLGLGDGVVLALGVDVAWRAVLPLPTGALMSTLGFMNLTLALV